MKAAVTTEYGAPEIIKVQDVTKPVIKDKEVLIKVKAAALNSGDVRVRSLKGTGLIPYVIRLIFGWKKPRNGIQGLMFSGIVEAVGKEVSNWKIGDQVYGSTGMKMGAHAEYLKLKSTKNFYPKPDNATFKEAAALIFGGSTALYFLRKAGIEKITQPKVLIYGATGSVGCASVEIAKYFGADVTAVCSRKGEELTRSMGADQVVIYTEQDYSQLDEKFDIILDAVGKTNKKTAKPILKPDGKYITVSGMDVASETVEQLKLLKSMFEEGKIHAHIDKTYSLDEIVEAHTYVDSERKKGNVVINIQ